MIKLNHNQPSQSSKNPFRFLWQHKKWVVLVAVVLVAGFFVRSRFAASAESGSGEVAGAEAEHMVGQAFFFQGRSAEGLLTDQSLELEFVNVAKQEEVLIRGQRAQAKNGKVFLVFEIALRNNTDQVLYLDPVDLVRWIETEKDYVAPQVSQGNLEVRPQSTKKSNLGFVVPDAQKDFSLQVGELDGEKSTFEIEL